MNSIPKDSKRSGDGEKRRSTTHSFRIFLSGILLLNATLTQAGTVVREYERAFTTYPFSDPDPVPVMSKFYPYFRFDGYAKTPVEKTWKVVELSNRYLEVLILPEIGGKIWTAIEKSTGKPFIYFNQVVKFRDVAMRGPWTSGGIEANYGIMGHTPNCSTPVDYTTRRNPDGSASCIIGTLDLLTRTSWRLEINLPEDSASFTTKSFWHNSSGLDQPYYTWMNAGIKAAGNLQLVNPGTHYIGHDGEATPWPINPINGRDGSWYEQNNFGSYKSYHVVGRLSDFWGGYWHDDDFGMAHVSPFGDKPGRKIWIWGLSREGMIWEPLLTDHDGQYVEVQAGRFFNQADSSSSRTPFKQAAFLPYATETWTEHWLPVKGTKGFVSASPWGALNVEVEPGQLEIRISPAREWTDTLQVFDGEHLLHSTNLKLKPMEATNHRIPLEKVPLKLRVRVGDKIIWSAGDENVLERPLESATKFDWNSNYGRYLKGRDTSRQRDYKRASEELRACLERDPHFSPALVELAAVENKRGHYGSALEFARRALEIDTYDAEANYQYGFASAKLGKDADAEAAFSLAAISSGWRSAACTELARHYLRQGKADRAAQSASEALIHNTRNIAALHVSSCAHRVLGQSRQASRVTEAMLKLDPLCHAARFERVLLGKMSEADFKRLIRNELPVETYLELACSYVDMGRHQDAVRLLQLAPAGAEVLYWLAFLRSDAGMLKQALHASPEFVFPFRPESIAVFQWASRQSAAWQPRYFLALVHWANGDTEPAQKLLSECGNEPDFAPFYAARAQLYPATAEADLDRSALLSPGQWRYGAMRMKRHIENGEAAKALAIGANCRQRFPHNDAIALLNVKALMLAQDYQSAAGLLEHLNLLPAEGTTEARAMHHEAHLLLAARCIASKEWSAAEKHLDRARSWPENLGAGKPYPDFLDESVEDWLAYQSSLGRGDSTNASRLLNQIVNRPAPRPNDASRIVLALALRDSGNGENARKLVEEWTTRDNNPALGKWAMEMLENRPSALPPETRDVRLRALAISSGN